MMSKALGMRCVGGLCGVLAGVLVLIVGVVVVVVRGAVHRPVAALKETFAGAAAGRRLPPTGTPTPHSGSW